MLDLKQLKYFIVCAETGSISEAAKLLYTTQPSVSKAIKALEEEMGIVLFERMPRGIALTAKGREAYRYACRIINDSRILEEMSHGNMAKYLRISLNPSSWFTNQFVEFYKENYDKDYHFEIYTAGVRTVMERVRDYLSDIGFVYVMEQQKKEFQYELAKNKLVFTVMQESTATFYPGKLNILDQEAADRENAQTVNMEAMKNFRFIQNFRDEFLELGEKESEPQIRRLPILCHPDVKRVRGTLEELKLLSDTMEKMPDGSGRADAYVSVVLTDEKEMYDFRERLEELFAHILEIRVDNERTRKRLEEEPEETGAVTPFQAFASFYEAVRHCPMTEEQETILARMVEEAEEEERV